MKTITAAEAFSSAPPRSAAVLCLKGTDGATDMILTDWFTWLNFKRNPMISFSLPRNAAYGTDLRDGDTFALAFPPAAKARDHRGGIRVRPGNGEETPEKETACAEGIPVRFPEGSETVLLCTLAGAYNYPFKKVRIFNCNLEAAFSSDEAV